MDKAVVLARRGLLDALEALQSHLSSIVLVGAQAIYMHLGSDDSPLAPFTTDGDLVMDPVLLAGDPLIESALKAHGIAPLVDFQGNRVIGSWTTEDGVAIDLMVPAALAGQGRAKSRGVDLPPHGRHDMRRTRGLEGALVEHEVLRLDSYEDSDVRYFDIRVAGPGALLVAKLHKVADRLEGAGNRLSNKDAHDIYRLLRRFETEDLAARLTKLASESLSLDATLTAIQILSTDFSDPESIGSKMAGEAEKGLGDPDNVALSTSILTNQLVRALATQIQLP